MSAINTIRDMRAKGYQLQCRNSDIILFRPDQKSARADAGEAFNVARISSVCGPWEHERDGKELAVTITELLQELTNE